MERGRMALMGVALVVGIMIGLVDSSPKWNDTGITVGALLLVCGFCGAAAPKSPWQWALAVGAWIPLLNILRHGNYGSLLALVVAFIAAYGGAFARRLLILPATA